jgi:tetratricopeptide (TPR) repeat protein
MEELAEVAAAAYRQADEKGSAVGAFNYGVVLENRGELGAAKEAYRRAIERGHPGAGMNLGQLLEAEDDLEGAEAAYRRAADRGHTTGAHALARLLEARGEIEEAAQVRAAAGDLPPTPEEEAAAVAAQRRRVQIWLGGSGVVLLIGLVSLISGNIGALGFIALVVVCAMAGLAVSRPLRAAVVANPILLGVPVIYLLWVWNFEPWFAVVFGLVVTAAVWWVPRELQRRREQRLGA